ncbi:hypothetical protein CLAIMM_08633 [Cladophialophora immunda]|nr:hypothetical protein CLAIMM_08633 [Cladophialophora immunda]
MPGGLPIWCIGPFCGLLLANWGATVLRIDRPGPSPTGDLLTSHKASIALDLKSTKSRPILLSLIPKADILIDPFRPGVLEKLDLDPQTVLLKTNPELIVVRLTGFRRDGKYSTLAGHDINYLAVSGVLSLLGPRKLRRHRRKISSPTLREEASPHFQASC